MGTQVAKIETEKLAPSMTCPICNKFFRDATTIPDCLHTFCRKCIQEKITEDDVGACPVCNTDLGGAPLNRLRSDHNLRDVRLKLFPYQKHKSMEPKAANLMPSPARRRQRSLSSLETTSPKEASDRSSPTGEKSKESSPMKNPAPPESIIPIKDFVKEVEDRAESLKISSGEAPQQEIPKKHTKNNAEPLDGKADMWGSLTCLVEAASKTMSDMTISREIVTKLAPLGVDGNDSSKLKKVNSQVTVAEQAPSDAHGNSSSKLNSQETVAKPAPLDAHDISCSKLNKLNSHETVAKAAPLDAGKNKSCRLNKLNPQEVVDKQASLDTEVKDCGAEPKVPGNGDKSIPASSGSGKSRRSKGARQKQAATSEGQNLPARAVVVSNRKSDGRNSPVWFSLIAASNQAGDAPLPQIPSHYLRVKDGNMTVASIKRYLMKKLDLNDESEVEISVRGEPVISTMQLHHLIEWWVRTTPASERMQGTVGSSAEEFVMVLQYARKI